MATFGCACRARSTPSDDASTLHRLNELGVLRFRSYAFWPRMDGSDLHAWTVVPPGAGVEGYRDRAIAGPSDRRANLQTV